MSDNHEAMFGRDPETMLEQLAEPLADRGLSRVLNNILSDAQELAVVGRAESARKLINCVKYIIDTQLPNVRATSRDVAVHFEVGQLRAMHSITTDSGEGMRNAEFSAKLHNAAASLFDAAELVQHVLTEQEKLPPGQRNAYIVERAAATLAALKKSQL